MKIEAITIDGVAFDIVEGSQEPPCFECEFYNNGLRGLICRKLCMDLLKGNYYPKRKETKDEQ